MPNYWFFITDPDSYHLDEVFKKKSVVWDGVMSNIAQKHLSTLQKGDRIIGYHSAPQKAAYAVLEAVSSPYQNPELKDRNLVVDVCGIEKLKRPVALGEMKSSAKLKQMKLFKMFRPISITPLTAEEFREICRLGSPK